jgi:hypothetical protein
LYLLAREIFGSSGPALLSTALFALLGIISADRFLQNIAYASRIGWVVGWFGLMAAHRHLRTGAKGLALLAIVTAPALMGIHILSSAQYLTVLGCLALAVLLGTPLRFSLWKRATLVLALAFAVTLPFLASRLLTTYRVLNPIFDHLQGLLLLGKGWFALHAGEFLRTLGLQGLTALLVSFLLWKHRRSLRGAALLFTLAWVPVLLVAFPPTLTLMERFHAHSLTFRLLLIVPTSLILGWAVAEATENLKTGGRRLRGVLVLAVPVFAVILHTGGALGRWSLHNRGRAAWEEQRGLVEALAWLEERFPAPQVVLSDPLSSYAIPAYTRHYTVAPFHQHSSPTDESSLRRMEAAQAALNGLTGIRATCDILERYGVDLILLNQGFGRFQNHYGMFLSQLVYDLQSAKFDSHPQLFSRIHDQLDIVIFRYEGKRMVKRFLQGTPLDVHSLLPENSLAPEGLKAGADLPPVGTVLGVDVPPWAEDSAETLRVEVRDPPNPYRIEAAAQRAVLKGPGVEFLKLEPPTPTRAGEPIALTLHWGPGGTARRLPAQSIVVLKSDPPAGYLERLPFQPLLRWLWEWRTGRVYRFAATRMPMEHFYPPFLWKVGEVYRDVLYLWIPPRAVPGHYRIHLKLRERPFTDNWEMRDLLNDEGSHVGPVIGEVEILAPDNDSP